MIIDLVRSIHKLGVGSKNLIPILMLINKYWFILPIDLKPKKSGETNFPSELSVEL